MKFNIALVERLGHSGNILTPQLNENKYIGPRKIQKMMSNFVILGGREREKENISLSGK